MCICIQNGMFFPILCVCVCVCVYIYIYKCAYVYRTVIVRLKEPIAGKHRMILMCSKNIPICENIRRILICGT